MLTIKNITDCRWDLVSLGEILLRFDPGDRRIHTAREFMVWDGGAEYNVAANASRVFRRRSAIVTALADNSLGHLAEELARAAGVDVSLVLWRAGGSGTRNGLYFIERGHGLRPPASTFDRAGTAVSQLKAGDIDWQGIFTGGVRWFHTGGVFTGLSDTTPGVAAEAMIAARDAGTIVSYDLNYRHSLWGERGGRDAANSLNRELLPHADVVFGAFGFDSTLSHYNEISFRRAGEKMIADFPNLKVVVSTLRETHSASRHDLGGVCLADGQILRSKDYTNMEVLDRVGSGDAFAAAFISSMLSSKDAQFALDCGAAHGSLAMTTPGDVSMSTIDEVLALMQGAGAGAKR
jgi:2-dehydro-3-deoxygluconokinase